jgi:3-(3-hydroxy-phenyl)propionate hydroxylase
MTALLFGEGSPNAEQTALLDRLSRLDKRFAALVIQRNGATANALNDADGEIARLYGAEPGTLYLLRPDLHIAGRWKSVAADEILHTARLCLGVPPP